MKKIENLFIERVKYSRILNDCFKARYQVYCKEKKWIDPKVCLNEKESDFYDKVSRHVIIYNDKWKIQGYARFIVKSNGISLPIESHPGIKNRNIIAKKAGESSRFIVLNKEIRMAITFILLRSLFQIAVNLKINNSYIVVEPPFVRYLRKIGYVCETLSEPEIYFGDYTVPVKVDVNATSKNLSGMEINYSNWFCDESPFVSKNDFIFNYIYAPVTA